MAFNDAQKMAIRHREGPMLVLAGPGSGKTTVITNRVRYLTEKAGVDPSHILVITFTRAAAREMKERYEQITQAGCSRVSFGTFHSVFFLILKLAYRYKAADIVREEQRVQFMKEMLSKCDLEVEDEGEFISSVLSEISMVKGDIMDMDHYYAKNCSEDMFRQLYRGYEARLRQNRLLDFDDMLVMCYELFKERKDILSAWQDKYRYILIDEFQDINRIQYEIVKMLALPRNNLFIVGDDDQSIYRFRGAKPELMLGFETGLSRCGKNSPGYQLPLQPPDCGGCGAGYLAQQDPFSQGNQGGKGEGPSGHHKGVAGAHRRDVGNRYRDTRLCLHGHILQ